MQNIVNDFGEVIVRGIDPSDYKHLWSDSSLILTAGLVASIN